MAAYGDNPAKRLLDILTAAKAHPNHKPRSGWAAVFGVPEADLGEILRRGAMTYGLALETPAMVRRYPDDDPELILQNFDGAVDALSRFQNMAGHQTMAQFLQPYTPLAEYSLRHAASLLHRRQAEPVIAQPTLKNLTDQTRELIDSISASDDLDSDLKLWAVDLLREVEAALVRVRLGGTADVERATDRLVGGLVRRPSRLARFMTHPAWTGVMGLITALNLALGTASEWQQLTSDEQQQIVVNVIQPPSDSGGPAAIGPGDSQH